MPPRSSGPPVPARCWSWAPGTAATRCTSPVRVSPCWPRTSARSACGNCVRPPATKASPSGLPPAVHDVRKSLPLGDASVDAVFAHMLLCMALSTKEIHALVAEVRRVLRPGGAFVYTVRRTGDAHYRAGIGHGDDIWEHGGFAVHFFPRHLVDDLAEGWSLQEVHAFEEGDLPRWLWRVTQTMPR
ncbi:methyltransferase domain-containing protein [Streptomyces sp. NPDC002521]